MVRRVELEEPFRSLGIYLELLKVGKTENLIEYLSNVKFPEVRRPYVKSSLEKLKKAGLIEYEEENLVFVVSSVNEGDVDKLLDKSHLGSLLHEWEAGDYKLKDLYNNIELCKKVFSAYFYGMAEYNREEGIISVNSNEEINSTKENEKSKESIRNAKTIGEALAEYFKKLNEVKSHINILVIL